MMTVQEYLDSPQGKSDPRDVSEIGRTEEYRPGYGGQVLRLTRAQIEALLAGSVLDCNILGEYSALILVE